MYIHIYIYKMYKSLFSCTTPWAQPAGTIRTLRVMQNNPGRHMGRPVGRPRVPM